MKKCLYLTGILVLLLCPLSWGIDESKVLPFGSMYLHNYSAAGLDTFAATCMNYMGEYNPMTGDQIDGLWEHGAQSVRGGLYPSLTDAEAPFKYSQSNYAEIDVRSSYPNPEVRMVPFGGHFEDEGNIWVADTGSVETLSGFSTYLATFNSDPEIKNEVWIYDKYFFNLFGTPGGKITYQVEVDMGINWPDSMSNETVATVVVGLGQRGRCNYDILEYAVPLSAFGADTAIQAIDCGWFVIPDSLGYLLHGDGINCGSDSTIWKKTNNYPAWLCLNLTIETSGAREVRVDKVRIFDEEGKLTVNGGYDREIGAKFREFADRGEKIYGWDFMDEPWYTNVAPFAHIAKVMHDSGDANWIVWTDFPHWDWSHTEMLANTFVTSMGDEAPYLNTMNYPFIIYDCDSIPDPCPYSGTNYQDIGKYGLEYFGDKMAHLREVADANEVKSWALIQAYDACYMRFPTAPEISVQTFMALAWGAKGICPWPYGNNPEGNGDPIDYYHKGIIEDTIPYTPTPLYYEIKDHIGPYLQAFDEYYMPLRWDMAYAYHPTSHPTPPAGALVSSISAVCAAPDSSDYNPDLGWFEVGEYTDTVTFDRYVMIVNRACNYTESISAPAIIATVRLDSTYLGFGHAFLVDLAGSRHQGVDSGWVADPETTYTCYDNGISMPFAVFLRPGEGRMFKILEAPVMAFSGAINTSYTYQGYLPVTGDVTINSGSAFKVRGPARFDIANCDDQHSGLDTGAVEIVCNGVLKFVGNQADSICFDKFFNCGAGIVNGFPGIWYGIRDRSDDHDTLSYCVVKFAYRGFRADTNSNATIRHCELSRSEDNGVYLYNTFGDTTVIDSCLFRNNDTGGISGIGSLFIARGNTLVDGHLKGAIYINGKPNSGTILAHVLFNNFVHYGQSTGAIGIRIVGNASSKPWVVLSGNTVRRFSTGIYLNYGETGSWSTFSWTLASPAEIWSIPIPLTPCNVAIHLLSSTAAMASCLTNNSFSYNSSYGIYCSNSSSPKIKETLFLSNGSAVGCASSSLPNLGDSVEFYGSNIIVPGAYAIYNMLSPLQVVKAMGNWWDDSPPDTSKFYPRYVWTNYRRYLQSNPCTGQLSPRLSAEGLVPIAYSLSQNYPNPFNPSTNIAFDLPQNSYVRLSVFNILGQRIRTVASGDYPAGSHLLRWDGRADNGAEVSSGVYFYLLEAGDYRSAKKMLMVR